MGLIDSLKVSSKMKPTLKRDENSYLLLSYEHFVSALSSIKVICFNFKLESLKYNEINSQFPMVEPDISTSTHAIDGVLIKVILVKIEGSEIFFFVKHRLQVDFKIVACF